MPQPTFQELGSWCALMRISESRVPLGTVGIYADWAGKLGDFLNFVSLFFNRVTRLTLYDCMGSCRESCKM